MLIWQWNNPSLCPDADIVPRDGSTQDLSPSNLCSLTRYASSQIWVFYILHKSWYNTRRMNSLNVAHNFVKTGDERLDYRVNFVEFKYCWDWRSCPLYGIQVFPHFGCMQTYVNAFGTLQTSICNTVESHFLGLSIRQSSTVGAWCTAWDR